MRELFLGKICAVNGSNVRVDYLGTISAFVPYLQTANSFKRHFTPPRVGEAVLLVDLGGLKVAIGSFLNDEFSAPNMASQTKEISQYEDGTIISYDTATSTLEITNPKTINITALNDINITCKSANLTAQTTSIKSPAVQILGNTTIQGTISTSGSGGSSGSFEIKGNLKIDGNITTTGNITDARGDLTGHSHSDTDGYTSTPR